MTVPALEINSVSKSFDRGQGRLEVLDDVSLAVGIGEFVSVLGASGCGKTTLLRIVDGLEGPTSGTVLVGGHPDTRPGSDRAFVFQNDTLFPWRSILRNVALGLELRGSGRRQRQEMARQYLALVGLSGYESYRPYELSGGMRQRANLARALVMEPAVLLMDEPFASLDSQTRELMSSELLRIWAKAETSSILFVTHQIDEAVYLSDRVVILSARPGRVKRIVEVPFDRPRSLDIKRTAPFTELVESIWKDIEQEALISFLPRR